MQIFFPQITVLSAKAEALLALADRLEIKAVVEVVEKYLVSSNQLRECHPMHCSCKLSLAMNSSKTQNLG